MSFKTRFLAGFDLTNHKMVAWR